MLASTTRAAHRHPIRDYLLSHWRGEQSLAWSYWVNNYLLGKTPPPFDLLYWNSDSTNLPGAMFAYYIRNTYLENNLRKRNKLTMCGEKIDLGRITVPTYIMASREDHIVPWKTAFAGSFVLTQ